MNDPNIAILTTIYRFTFFNSFILSKTLFLNNENFFVDF